MNAFWGTYFNKKKEFFQSTQLYKNILHFKLIYFRRLIRISLKLKSFWLSGVLQNLCDSKNVHIFYFVPYFLIFWIKNKKKKVLIFTFVQFGFCDTPVCFRDIAEYHTILVEPHPQVLRQPRPLYRKPRSLQNQLQSIFISTRKTSWVFLW